jgi:hypothetical protein
MKIHKPLFNTITQGTIFSCAKADRYIGKLVHGLAITARCDIAKDKHVLNYLPVVTLHDWLHCDGLEILFANSLKSAQSDFNGLLRNAQISISVLDSVPRKTVVESFFDSEDALKPQKKQSAMAHKISDLLYKLEAFVFENQDDRDWFLNAHKLQVSALLKDLIDNKVPSFYFLPSATEDNENNGCVVLLRESSILPRQLAKEVASGIEQKSGVPNIDLHLSFAIDDFAQPVGQVPSPNIEHILQTFSYMFGRIGLENYSSNFSSEVCNRNFVKKVPTTQ